MESADRSPSIESLCSLLRELGVPCTPGEASASQDGFPVQIELKTGDHLTFELPNPGILASMQPADFGAATVDQHGNVRATWGLANGDPFLERQNGLEGTELAVAIESAMRGQVQTVFLESVRYYVAKIPGTQPALCLVILVAAPDEQRAIDDAAEASREAEILGRLGRAVSMHQHVMPMAADVMHSLAASMDLAAALLWAVSADGRHMDLLGTVGVNRQAVQLVAKLAIDGARTCAAEFVAETGRTFQTNAASTNALTKDFEARFCYLAPGGIFVAPLVVSGNRIGVVELIGKEGDVQFLGSFRLCEQIAENVALALNGAMLFEGFERQASFDPLTGLANFRSLQEFLSKRIAEARRHGTTIGVILLDVDHFRSFNEEEGHDAGDDVLRIVSSAIESCLRPYDLAARYGGEEFVVVMPGVSEIETMAIAERIRREIEASNYVTSSGRTRSVTASLGCALFPSTSEHPSDLLKAADRAMYQAKHAGRNQSVMYEGPFGDEACSDMLDIDALRKWVEAQDLASSERLCEYLGSVREELVDAFRISRGQWQVLRGLAVIAMSYRRWARIGNNERTAAFERDPSARVLIPSLTSLDSRYDADSRFGLSGSRIPLLARIMSVLIALTFERGAPIVEDPGKFDPAVVEALINCQRAA